jgi:hypothetical protein
MSVTMVQLIEPGYLGRELNVSTHDYVDDYGIMQGVNNFLNHLKQLSQDLKS